MRTLSARILLGFAALTVAFAVITGNIVHNMGVVEGSIDMLDHGLIPLTLAAKDLHHTQDELYAYLTRPTSAEWNATAFKQDILRQQHARQELLGKTEQAIDALIAFDLIAMNNTRQDVVKLRQSVNDTAPFYELVLATPPLGNTGNLDAKESASLAALQKLRELERVIRYKAGDIDRKIEDRLHDVTPKVTANGHTVRVTTIYLGLTAVILGLLTTIWVVVTLRPLGRLRAAARRIAAGDYANRIPEDGPQEVAELAREFNAMGTAVEEREREIGRSERLAAVGKMAAVITHEVRNPLSSIGLNTELLEEELEGSPNEAEARGLCRAITHEVDRLTAITEEYLAFARLPKPKIAAEAVNPMLDALAAFVRQDLAQKHVKLALELGSDGPIAAVDAAQLRQCLINLVRNAAEAVACKGAGTITLRTAREGERVTIDVADDGAGIAPDVLPRLFDPFFSTKEGGSGLGLALTKQIVKDHGGDIAVISTVGQGTTFTVSLPAAVEVAIGG